VPPGKGGFTLLEILLVIGLIGLLGGFLLTDWGNVAEAFGRRDWRQTAEESFRRGHFLAETSDRSVRLRFDDEERAFVLEDAETGEPLERLEAPGIEAVNRIDRRRGAGRIGLDDSPLGGGFSVRFGTDGSAEAVRFEVVRSGGTAVLRNHPFSGRVIAADEEVESPLYAEE
jgi:prepilin-type N-terminal cleavage/methylation domain-containing protein